ncbi:MAG TPA: sugar isomerase [Phycisphaerae bacterium]|nr:sugar isomerase [Phycisphaerae bacterium]HRY70991.1 sugar isomerase [Phycisphaerae bacterium]HSA29262.1 sugar isomerase [Phycisphaerae bacterium]
MAANDGQEMTGITRRGFFGAVGGTMVAGSAALTDAGCAEAASVSRALRSSLVPGRALRVKPALAYAIPQRQEKTSWRPYGGLKTRADVDQEARRIEQELKTLAAQAEFAVEVLPLTLVGDAGQAAAVTKTECDTILVFGSGGDQGWLETMAASGKPNLLFVRHRSGPVYLWYEIAHWRLLRKSEDAFKEPNLDVDDVVVDDYGELLWRLRALYGLKNARGTVSVALGGLQAYSKPGQERGPAHVKEVWGYDVKHVPVAQIEGRLRQARADVAVMREVERQADDLLAQPNVTLGTERRFVVNSFLALRVFKAIMKEAGATNLGVANCMGPLIGLLDTPPCLVLSLLNDEGWTAFCHADYTHTPPGVLLRWISGKPSLVSNSHFPHDGVMTLAHCAAPRRMNGQDYEPTRILTHFESDYGAATKVEYAKGQVTTNIIPNLRCTKWYGFRGRILDSPAYDMCRSQMDVRIDGDWRRLLRTMEGFHTITCYGDYLREAGYALKKLQIEWDNVSA